MILPGIPAESNWAGYHLQVSAGSNLKIHKTPGLRILGHILVMALSRAGHGPNDQKLIDEEELNMASASCWNGKMFRSLPAYGRPHINCLGSRGASNRLSLTMRLKSLRSVVGIRLCWSISMLSHLYILNLSASSISLVSLN